MRYMLANHRIGQSMIAGAGLGAFTMVDIPARACLGRYEGRVLGEEEIEHSSSAYLLERRRSDGKKEVVDADEVHGNWLRFLNQNNPGCGGNNVYITEAGYFKTSKPVKAGQELYVHYGPDYWPEGVVGSQ